MNNAQMTLLPALLFSTLLSVAVVAGPVWAASVPAGKAAPRAKKSPTPPKVLARAAVSTGHVVIAYPPPPNFVPPSASLTVVGPAEAAQSDSLCQSGVAKAGKGDWAGASSDYAQALALWPDSKEALYGAARCAAGMGDVPSALNYYRMAVYSSAPFPYVRKLREPYAFRAMPFVLLLNEAGQAAEAVSVYNQVVGLLNHEDGKEHALEADLPVFGGGPGQMSYTPQMLEAMAHLAIGIDTFGHEGYGDPEPLANFKQALALAPDSAAANFYLGRYLYGKHDPGAKAALERAVQLGDDRTAKAAKDTLQFIR